MENYMKAVLCVYPLMQRMENAYEEHIKNKALRSCDGRMATESLVEYLAEEILRKRRLTWLREMIKDSLSRLSDLERTLVEGCLFSGKSKEKSRLVQGKNVELTTFSERTRFRMQFRALQKLERLLVQSGVTKEVFERELVKIELIRRMYKKMNKERE